MHTALKNEKGARLGYPWALIVETQAIGLGTTVPKMIRLSSDALSSAGLSSIEQALSNRR